MRQCTGCDRTLDDDAFGWKDREGQIRRTRCNDCYRAYQRRWYSVNRSEHRELNRVARRKRYDANRQMLNRLRSAPCADCSLRFIPQQMDFDHVRGTKEINVTQGMWNWSQDRLLREIAKCEVVCAVCHRLRTARRRDHAEEKP